MPKFIDSTKRQPWATFRNLANGAAEIKIIGDIGCPKEYPDFWTGEMQKQPGAAGTYEEFDAELTALGDITDLTLMVSSRGGDYFTGLAIHDRLLRHPANKTCIIDGICASAATYIPVACQTVKMPATAQFMIHCAESCECGNAEDMLEMAAMLQVIDQNIAELYATRVNKSAEELLAMMEVETWLNGKQCLELGFATELISAAVASSSNVDSVTNKRVFWNFAKPAAGLALFDTLKNAKPNAQSTSDDFMNKILIALANKLGITIAETTSEADALAAIQNHKPAAPNVVIDFESDEVKTAFTNRITEATKDGNAKIAALEGEITNLKALITNGAAGAAGGNAPVPAAPKKEEKVMNRAAFNQLTPREQSDFCKAKGIITD